MFTKKKPLIFVRAGATKPDIENAADAKKPGDAREDSKTSPKKPTMDYAKKAATVLATKGDVGKHNNGTTTGFSAVAKNATKEYGSAAAGQKVAGAVFQKMKKRGQL